MRWIQSAHSDFEIRNAVKCGYECSPFFLLAWIAWWFCYYDDNRTFTEIQMTNDFFEKNHSANDMYVYG